MQLPTGVKSGLNNWILNWALRCSEHCSNCVALSEQHVDSQAGFFSLVFALDDMGTRINDLEKNVVELMTQAGMEEQASSKWQQAHSSSARWAVTSRAKKMSSCLPQNVALVVTVKFQTESRHVYSSLTLKMSVFVFSPQLKSNQNTVLMVAPQVVCSVEIDCKQTRFFCFMLTNFLP